MGLGLSDEHTVPRGGDAALAEVRAVLERARERLLREDVPTEVLGRYEPPTKRLGLFPVAERIAPIGRVWRIGVLLLTPEGALHAVGHQTRAKRLERVGYVAESARRRDELRDAAARGGITAGTSVDFDTLPLPLDRPDVFGTGPLALRDGAAVVRWAPHAPLADAVAIDDYVDERVDLLVDAARRR